MAGEYDKSKYTRKERLLNFWYYHRLYIIIGVLVVLFVVVQVHKLTHQPSIGFQGVFMNVISAEQDDGTDYAAEFGKHLGVDTTRFFMDIIMYEHFDISEKIDEVDYASVQQLSAYIANGDLDVAVTDKSAIITPTAEKVKSAGITNIPASTPISATAIPIIKSGIEGDGFLSISAVITPSSLSKMSYP